VKVVAAELGLPVSYDAAAVVGSGAELGVVVAYGRIIKPDVLEKVPMVNVHFSLLPRWRGAAPVERAVLAGDKETGVCLMKLEEGLDTGPIFACRAVSIGPEETVTELRGRLGDLGTEMLLGALSQGFPEPVAQVGEPSYANKVDPSELRLDFELPAEVCLRAVRVGRAWTTWRGRRLIVHRARLVDHDSGADGGRCQAETPVPAGSIRAGSIRAGSTPGAGAPAIALEPGELAGDLVGTGAGTLQLLVVQPEGKAPLAVPDWLRGTRPVPGERLGA
jgi:methionyl-tRNA formyltransferase